MESNQLEINSSISTVISTTQSSCDSFSLETEIPEVLYKGMKDFLVSNPKCDQNSLMSTAIANFLFQNGCTERAVTEKYLNDLFMKN